MSRLIDPLDLVTYGRIAEIARAETEGKFSDFPQVLRKWRSRGDIQPIRGDLSLFHWPTVRPIIARKLKLPESQWAGVPAYRRNHQ